MVGRMRRRSTRTAMWVSVFVAAMVATSSCGNSILDSIKSVDAQYKATELKNSAKALTVFGFVGPASTGIVNETNKTIAVTVPYLTSVTALVATFATTGSSVKIGTTVQASGITANDFTNPVTYAVAAINGSTQNYVVTVTATPALTAFGFGSPAATGVINEANKTIAVNVPFKTTMATMSSLVATFSSTGSTVKIGGVGGTIQLSGTTPNDFSSQKTYTVVAADGSSTNYLVTVKASALTWTNPAAPGLSNTESMVVSSDGSHLATSEINGYVWTSPDHGVTWTKQLTSGNKVWYRLASDDTGQYLAAALAGNGTSVPYGDIWTSADYGVNWTDRTASGTLNWQAITSSSDGVHLAAVVYDGDIWTSANSGLNWTDRNAAGSRKWLSIASSADGSRLAATDYTYPGDIWTSSDYGAHWTDQVAAGSNQWFWIASSSNGRYLAAVGYSGDIWTSADYGVTWIDRVAAGYRAWWAISSSADGSHLVAAEYGGDIWTSADFGTTWTDQTGIGAGSWRSIALSADGSLIAAVTQSGSISIGK